MASSAKKETAMKNDRIYENDDFIPEEELLSHLSPAMRQVIADHLARLDRQLDDGRDWRDFPQAA
jgi:hypothetical protein